MFSERCCWRLKCDLNILYLLLFHQLTFVSFNSFGLHSQFNIRIYLNLGRDSLVGIATRYRLDYRRDKSFLHSSPEVPWGPNSLLCSMLGAHSRGQRGRVVALTTSFHYSPRLWISSYTSPPLYCLHGMLQDELNCIIVSFVTTKHLSKKSVLCLYVWKMYVLKELFSLIFLKRMLTNPRLLSTLLCLNIPI